MEVLLFLFRIQRYTLVIHNQCIENSIASFFSKAFPCYLVQGLLAEDKGWPKMECFRGKPEGRLG